MKCETMTTMNEHRKIYNLCEESRKEKDTGRTTLMRTCIARDTESYHGQITKRPSPHNETESNVERLRKPLRKRVARTQQRYQPRAIYSAQWCIGDHSK